MHLEEFIEKLKIMFRSIEVEELEGEYLISYESKKFNLNKLYLKEIIQRYSNLDRIDETTISNFNYYETRVDEINPLFRGELFAIADDHNKINYEIGAISDEYIIFLLDKVIDENNIRYVRRHISMNFFKMRIKEIDEFMDVLRLYLRRITTIRIMSDNNLNINKFKERTDALLFNIALNTGKSIIPVKYFDDVFDNTRLFNRRSSLQQMESPQRKYISDLVYYYQLGISTHDPSQKFISFYHVIEYFFNKVYSDSLVESVRNDITSPKFSVKRDADINRLIKDIKKKIKIDSETNNIKSEYEALRLTLKKYIDIDKLKYEIVKNDETYIDYYINTVVPFSQGNKVNFQESDVDKIFNSIANRIYKTRNAVIHSKLNEKSRYIPFRHEAELSKEIPLIKSIAEEIIISTSDII